MSGLRDARLRKALDAAPDDDVRPSRATRDAILARAHGALQRQRPASWWQRWRGSEGSSRMPWNAAFATFAIATLVTVVWHDRDVPGAKLDREQPTAVAPARAPATASAPVAASVPAPAPQVSEAPAVQPPAPKEPPRQRAKPNPPAQPRSAPAEPPPAMQSEVRSATPEAAAGQAQDSLRRSAAEASSGAAMRDSAQRQELAKAAPAASPPAAAPAPPSLAAAAPAPRMSSQMLAVSGSNTSARFVQAGMPTEIPLAQRRRLADLLNRVAGTARGSEPLEAPVDARIELFRDGQPAGLLELAGAQVRWRTGTDGGRTSRPDPALLQQLRDELSR